MPLVPLATLPDASRVWVFGSATPLKPATEQTFLRVVDDYLAQWKAHGVPLTVGRDWREGRFLTISVDTSDAAASGCSIDGLFRALRDLEGELGTSLVGSGRVYYRDETGAVASLDRSAFADLATRGLITVDTTVFDLTVPTLGEWRTRFETAAARSWHRTLLPAAV